MLSGFATPVRERDAGKLGVLQPHVSVGERHIATILGFYRTLASGEVIVE